MSRWQAYLPTVVVALCASSAIALLQLPNLQKLTDSTDVVSQDELVQKVEQENLRLDLWEKLTTLGFANLMADWMFLNFLQYFGDEESRRRTGYALSPDYFETILSKDPYFWDAYLFLPGSATMYAAMPERTIEIMEKYLPKLSPKTPDRAYFIWRWKATDELLFLDDVDAAIKSYQTAADWASEYNTAEGQVVNQISLQAAEFLKENPANKVVQINAWMSVYANAFDDVARELAIKNIRSLGGEVTLDDNGRIVEVKPPEGQEIQSSP